MVNGGFLDHSSCFGTILGVLLLIIQVACEHAGVWEYAHVCGSLQFYLYYLYLINIMLGIKVKSREARSALNR